MKAKILFSTLLAACAVSFTACSDDDGPSQSDITAVVIEKTETGSIQLSADYYLLDNARCSGAGFCYIEGEGTPTVVDNAVRATIDVDNHSFKATLDNLAPGKLYSVRAYVSVYQGPMLYSQVYTFDTAEGTLDEQLAHYTAPKYSDNYADISGWDKRDQWNLANVHDPTVMKADDGYYYMYQTDASYGNAHAAGGHFHGRRSKDLVNWEYLGGTMQSLPDWVVPKLNEIRADMGLPAATPDENAFGYWAPVARKVGNIYRMYYSIVCPGTIAGDGSWAERAFIGLMETSDPASNNWEDKGYVITNASDKGLNYMVPSGDWANCYYKFNAIDPSYIVADNDEHWLIYGSWNSGIAAVKVDPATGKPENLGNPWGTDAEIAPYGKVIATRQAGNRWQASEGPEIVYRNGYYYLFLAYDALEVAYNTRVVRSQSITGPYVGIDGTDVTAGGDALPVVTHPYKFANSTGYVGFSHCGIFEDGNDNWYYTSQARLPEGAYGNDLANALMMGRVHSIRWTKEGWPLVMPERYGAVPQVPITEEELVGNWEHIDLGYAYGTMKESDTMTLNADHTISAGTWQGSTWSYDAENQILTANGVDLYLARECDWEASPRTHTIVYAGVTAQKTYWGKKAK